MHTEITRLKISDVERRLAIHRQSIWRWVRDGKFPAPHYIGRDRRWFLHDIEEWEREHIKDVPTGLPQQATG